MGPFPHDAAPAKIDTANPAGTDGFGFVEFAHPRCGRACQAFHNNGFYRRRQAQDAQRHGVASGAM